MSKKIEIFENTLLKLLVRRGTDADRQNVVLAEGELGYTTDTKRLFVGDGSTPGGIAIGGGVMSSGGGRFIASVTDITTLNTAVLGDIAYDTDNKKLYTLTGGSPSVFGNWREIGGVYAAADGTITISSTNGIAVGSLSAGDISANAIGNSLVIDDSNKVGVSTTRVFTDSISSFSTPYLQLPAGTAINGVQYNWPAGGLAADQYLKIDASGNLSWSPAFTPTTLYSASTAGQIPVGSIMPFISSSNAPIGWLLCNGQSVTTSAYNELFAVIGYTYGGSGANFSVPNYINRTLYGVQNNPSTATTFSLASGTNSTLSASGALYIIKAKPDQVINVSTTINPPLTATQNGVQQSGSFNPLSGNIQIGLPILFTEGSQDFYTGVKVDNFGRVIGVPDPLSAGAIAIEEGTTSVVNYEKTIKFLTRPVEIANIGANNTFVTNVSVFPAIRILSFSGGGLVGFINSGYTLPSTATSVLIDSWASCRSTSTTQNECMFAGASDIRYLNSSTPSSKTLGVNEYLINYLYSVNSGNNNCSSNQVMIPLSADSAGKLTFGLRGTTQEITNNCYLRIVGYTE
jgi:microcystin-dependent protein